MALAEKHTLLITGGSGYLGRHVSAYAAKYCAVATTYVNRASHIQAGTPYQLDVTKADQTLALIKQLQPTAIIHCVAANPGSDESTMMTINAEGSRHIAQAAANIGARLVHVSTDMVHDGTASPYDDAIQPTPISTYGHSKALAETYIAQVHPGAAIVRTSLIYGLTDMDRGTAGFVARLKANETLTLFSDVVRQPVWTETLSQALFKLALENLDFTGILNVVGRQAIDRAAFGRKMLAWWRVDVDSNELIQTGFGANLPHPPPLDIRLNIAKGERVLGMTFPGVDDVLQQHYGLNNL